MFLASLVFFGLASAIVGPAVSMHNSAQLRDEEEDIGVSTNSSSTPKANTQKTNCSLPPDYSPIIDSDFVDIMVKAITNDLEYLVQSGKGLEQKDGSALFNLCFFKDDGESSQFMEEFDEDLISQGRVPRSIWRAIGEASRDSKRYQYPLAERYLARISKKLSKDGIVCELFYQSKSPWPFVKVSLSNN